jgi:hypothetical protein
MFLLVLRWIARLSALLIAGAFVLLIVGEFRHPRSGLPPSLVELKGIVLLTVTCCGMLIGISSSPGVAASQKATLGWLTPLLTTPYCIMTKTTSRPVIGVPPN